MKPWRMPRLSTYDDGKRWGWPTVVQYGYDGGSHPLPPAKGVAFTVCIQPGQQDTYNELFRRGYIASPKHQGFESRAVGSNA